MNDKQAKEILDKIIGQVFGFNNPFSLEGFKNKYAFDVRLPIQVNDILTGEPTWAQSINPTRFMSMENVLKSREDWTQPSRQLKDIQDILNAWEDINFTTAERQLDSVNIAESDNISESENVYHSLDVHSSKNIIFSDGAIGCENVAAVQRSNTVVYSARVEDSSNCSNSFAVSWSGKVVNSFFIHDAFDVYECMFCSHVRSKKYCIANMQFEEAEYHKLKDKVIKWILLAEA